MPTNAGRFHRRTTFDPILIIAQIVLIQSAFYLINGAWLILLSMVFGSFETVSLDALLSPEVLSEWWIAIFAQVLTFPTCGYVVHRVVERAKKCLDFSATIYILHLLVCWIYATGKFPSGSTWWIINILGFVGTAVESEMLCVRQEMKDIPLDRR